MTVGHASLLCKEEGFGTDMVEVGGGLSLLLPITARERNELEIY